MRQSRALTAAAFVCLLGVQQAAAQTSPPPQTAEPATAEPQIELPLPEQVVTATRIPTPLADVPAGVTVIDRATI
jgi:outer membrane cobalamin receptor